MFKKIAAITLIAFSITAPAHAYWAEQGTNLNGMRLNGVEQNGQKFNGMRMNGTGQAAAGFAIDGIELPPLSR